MYRNSNMKIATVTVLFYLGLWMAQCANAKVNIYTDSLTIT